MKYRIFVKIGNSDWLPLADTVNVEWLKELLDKLDVCDYLVALRIEGCKER